MAKVCRTCAQATTNEYFYLDGSIFASAYLQVKDILQSCIPEVDVDVVPNSAVCKNCMSALYIFYQFRKKTIKNERVFLSQQCIRVKNFEALARGSLGDDAFSVSSENSVNVKLNQHGAIEVELDDLDQLKTEVVYENVKSIIEEEQEEEDTPNNFTSYVEAVFPASESMDEQDEDDPCNMENAEVDCPPLVPLSESFNFAENFSDNLQADSRDSPDVDDPGEQKPSLGNLKEIPEIDVKKFIQCVGKKRIKRNVKRPYKCSECSFRSDAKAGLIMHSRIHTGEKPFHCTKCAYRAKRKAHLEDHMKIHTGERPYRCSICSKTFITKQILKKHALIHTGEKPYRCLQCNFRSRHKLTIANHVEKVHMGVTKKPQPSVCYICGKCLAGPASLSTHMKIHTGVKSHLCELCGRYFREKGMLKNHLRVHTGEKPFTCTECNYSATRKAHLQDHLRTHSIDRELVQCTECDKRYTTKILLRKHMKEEHQAVIKEENQAMIEEEMFI